MYRTTDQRWERFRSRESVFSLTLVGASDCSRGILGSWWHWWCADTGTGSCSAGCTHRRGQGRGLLAGGAGASAGLCRVHFVVRALFAGHGLAGHAASLAPLLLAMSLAEQGLALGQSQMAPVPLLGKRPSRTEPVHVYPVVTSTRARVGQVQENGNTENPKCMGGKVRQGQVHLASLGDVRSQRVLDGSRQDPIL